MELFWIIAIIASPFAIGGALIMAKRRNELNGIRTLKRPKGTDVPIASRPSESNIQDSKDVVTFKSTESAFKYCCRFMDTELRNDKRLPAIVLDASSLGAKQQVPTDEQGFQRAYLRVASSDLGFTVVGHTLSLDGPKLKPGDLVVWRPLKHVSQVAKKMKDPRNAWAGVIEARLHPTLSVKNGWAVEEKFRA